MDSSDVINIKTLFEYLIALRHINTLLICVTLLRNSVKKFFFQIFLSYPFPKNMKNILQHVC